MKKLRYIALALTTFLLASCAMEEMFDGFGPQDGEEVVMTFKPKFEDFETVTKAIGDASQINTLLVHVYEKDSNGYTLYSYEFPVQNRTVTEPINIPFYYGKEYEVYFWAYNSSTTSYQFNEDGLKYGVNVIYPSGALNYDSLEELDAFYSYRKIDLSKDDSDQSITLTRPFAQVNFIADKQQLANAMAKSVVFELEGSTAFTPGLNPAVGSNTDLTFKFDDSEYFQNNEVYTTVDEMDKVYLGTSYIFVGGSTSIEAYVTLLDKAGQVLKSRTKVSITLDANCRTNLTFSGIEPAWDDEAMDIPDPDGDGWIHISKPEELAQLLITGTDSETKVHICDDIDLSGIPADVKAQLALKSFANLTIDGGKYENHNVSGSLPGGGSYMIKNMTALAFLNEATDLTVRNLTFKGMKIWTAASHVGVIVNTLHGSSSFTNVIVEDSDVSTTNGAAGGMVGYIVRTSEKDRAESVSVTVDACKVNSTKAAGTLAEGKFVGMLSGYDNGEQLVFTSCSVDQNTSVTDWTSPYQEGNEGAWLANNDYTSYNGWLGDEVYYRGKVYFGGTDDATNRFCPKWDGEKSIDPIVENSSKLILSPFDLASLQNGTHSSVTFKENVDMNSRTFDPITKVTNITGNSKTIYNLKVDTMQDEGNSFGGAFMRNTGGGTHKDLTFDNADIKVVHNPHGTTGNAYGGVLSASVSSTHTVSNVHVKNSKLYAVCKMGGLVGRVHGGTFTCTGCSVDNCVLENYNAKDDDVFDISKETSGVTATAYAVFGTSGEAGGLIGFLCTAANISNCSVTNTTMNCFGQRDQEIKLNANVSGINGFGYFLVAGRHVNEFIGDIRTIYGEEITINECSISGNSYGKNSTDGDATHSSNLHNCHFYSATRSCEKQKSANSSGILPDYDYWFVYNVKSYTPFVGCVYYVGVDYGGIHVADTRGKVTIDDLVLDSIDEFVGGNLNNILDASIAPIWGNLKNLDTEIKLKGSYK